MSLTCTYFLSITPVIGTTTRYGVCNILKGPTLTTLPAWWQSPLWLEYHKVGKFRGCLNFTNFMVGLKSWNLTPTKPVQLNGRNKPHEIKYHWIMEKRDKTWNFRSSKFTNRTVLSVRVLYMAVLNFCMCCYSIHHCLFWHSCIQNSAEHINKPQEWLAIGRT